MKAGRGPASYMHAGGREEHGGGDIENYFNSIAMIREHIKQSGYHRRPQYPPSFCPS